MTVGLLGCLGAKLLFAHVDIYKLSGGNIPMFPVTADVVAMGLLVALGLGVASSIMPARSTIKATVVEGLRELD
jgi:hypothetical protein